MTSTRRKYTTSLTHSMRRGTAILVGCLLLPGCAAPLQTATSVQSADVLSETASTHVVNAESNPHQLATATSLMHEGNLEAARSILAKLLKSTPSDTAAVELLAEVSRKLGDLRLERACLKRLITLQTGSATVANRCGKRLLESLQMEASATAINLPATAETVGQLTTVSTEPQSSDGSSQDETTMVAVASLRNAVSLEPKNTLFAQDLFAALIDLELHDQAESVLQEALRQNPRDRVLPMTAARLYESQKDWSSAVFYYDVALRNDPANPVWRRHRAICHFRQGEYEKARTDFSRSLANSPVKPQLSEHLAWAEAALRTEDHEEAGRVLSLIVTEGEYRTADLEVLRGSCLLKQGEVEEAAEVVLQAQLQWSKHAGLWKLARQIKAAKTDGPIHENSPMLDLASLTSHRIAR